jgi:hypothetical protein
LTQGDKLVYSTELMDSPCAGIEFLLKKHGGDKDAVIASLVQPPCHVSMIAQLGIAFGACLGMTEKEFILAARRIRLGQEGKEGKTVKDQRKAASKRERTDD